MTSHNFYKTLGPGILFASTAIGVSHLVQSTRAGAIYGFILLWAVVAANVLKFPFFEYGSRYANVTGESLIDGYRRLGTGMLGLYALITAGTMFFVTAAVMSVSAGFMDHLFGISSATGSALLPTLLIFGICLVILLLGRYSFLDKLIKVTAVLLMVSTIAAFVVALVRGPSPAYQTAVAPLVFSQSGWPFLIALMGWMPTAVDLSTWNSLWTLERIRETGFHPTLRQTLREFNLGYWFSAFLSICFLTLGAFLVFGSSKALPTGSVGFAGAVVSLYTETIGDWSYWLIAVAGFSIMFGTAIGVLDGYARALERTAELVFQTHGNPYADRTAYTISLCITALGGLGVVWVFRNNAQGFKGLVDVATTLSFLVAPVIAWANLRLVTRAAFPAEQRPPRFLYLLSILGLIFLSLFGLAFIAIKIGLL